MRSWQLSLCDFKNFSNSGSPSGLIGKKLLTPFIFIEFLVFSKL